MQLLDNGIGVQTSEWVVNQEEPAGYSRVYFILSGEVTYYDAHITCNLLRDHLYVFPAQQPYRITHNPHKPIECLWLHIDFFPQDIDRILDYDLSSDNHDTIKAVVKALCNEGKFFKNNDLLYETLAQALVLCVSKHPFVKTIDSAFSEILNYLRENALSSSLSVKDISVRFGYSTAHFIRVFKAGMNSTPHKYITMLRMSAAVRYITDGYSVSETATLCGYSDPKTFSRVFAKSYGVPPSEYLRFYRPKA